MATGMVLVRYNPNSLKASISQQAEDIERAIFSVIEDNQGDDPGLSASDNTVISLIDKPGAVSQVYREIAEQGEGLTHLARRAVANYLEESDQNVSAEKKIYMEDYIQLRIDLNRSDGSRGLEVGQEIEISQELISEALSMAENLTTEDVTNLSYYAALVF